jgi:hypothetical protein
LSFDKPPPTLFRPFMSEETMKRRGNSDIGALEGTPFPEFR